MGPIESIVAVLAGLVAVGTAVAQIALWWRKRRAKANMKDPEEMEKSLIPQTVDGRSPLIPEGLPERLAPLVRMAYVMLRLDQLPTVGNWGFTINKYIELNYPHDQEILARKDSYLREGSITHTAHALRGLGFLHVAIPQIEPDLIRRWVDRNSIEVGLVAPDLPANPDEARGLAKEIRHTTTATLSLLRLRSHILNKASLYEVERWAAARARLLLDFVGVWVHDPRMTYSHAYLLELFDLLRHDPAYASVREQLDRQIVHGLHELFGNLSIRVPYWCVDSHPETKVFYTLLILARVIVIPELQSERAWVDWVCGCLEDVGRTARALGGVPLGQGPAGGRFATVDLGSTAAFLECCQRAYMLGFPVEHLVLQAAQLMDGSLDVLNAMTMNAITHTWESVLSLLETFRVSELFDVGSFCNEVDLLLRDVTSELSRGRQFPKKLVVQLCNAAGSEEQLGICIERDIWHSALKRREIAVTSG